jgi:hypothetical protein
MQTKLRRHKWLFVLIAIVALFAVSLAVFCMDFEEREDAVLEYFAQQEGMPETFAQLTTLTPADAVILCWWDYGRAVRNWSHRAVIEAYPSRDIWHTVGASRDFWHNLEAQVFGRWGSSERIHDLATIFMLPEEQALPLMREYNVSYAVVFTPDELQKFNWIAQIAGFNASDYVVQQDGAYQPTARGAEVTLLRLLFDDTLPPQHFTQIHDNGRGKIYRVDYP